MAEKVIMPKLEMAQESGKLVDWLKHEGDIVTKGEALFTIETDKITIDIEAPASGILCGIKARTGDDVPISTVIAYIKQLDEELPEGTTEVFGTSPQLPPAVAPKIIPTLPASISPLARKVAEENHIDLTTVTGTGPRGQITKTDIEKILEKTIIRRPGEKIRATPAVRRLAKQSGTDLSPIKGSGPRGRIHLVDIPELKLPFDAQKQGAYDVVPLEGMRKTIAQKMVASVQTIPHINFTIRVDMSRAETVRQQTNSEAQKQGSSKVTITTFFVMAAASALKRNPYLNSSLVNDEIHLYHDINIGVAVALENGLIVPVIHNADQYNVLEISNRLNDITNRARSGELMPKDVANGTFTISNLGQYGIEQFTAIINPPQTAILAIGAVQQEAIPDQAGQIVVKPMAHMTLSTDHRVVDGVMAASFLKDLKSAMEAASQSRHNY